MPKLVKLYIVNVAYGFGLSVVFLGLLLWADVAVPPDGMSLTFYTRFGDMYGLACAVATVLWLATAMWKRKKNRIF